MELTGTQKALAAREAELRAAAPAAQQLPGAQAEARRLQAQVRAARHPETLLSACSIGRQAAAGWNAPRHCDAARRLMQAAAGGVREANGLWSFRNHQCCVATADMLTC